MSEIHVVVLAAGLGKRMYSQLPKVLHPVLFRPMLHHVLDAAASLNPSSLTVVVGHGADQVRAACSAYPKAVFVHQREQKGTGHAVQQAVPQLEGRTGRVLVLCADVPLLGRQTLEGLLEMKSVACLLTAELDAPGAYGRILRDPSGSVRAIREAVDCSQAERAVREVNAGVYVFELAPLIQALKGLGTGNQQGEYYLTDVIESFVGQGLRVDALRLHDPNEMAGVNDRMGQALVENLLRLRVNHALMSQGVSFQDPASAWVDTESRISADVRIEAGCQIVRSSVGAGAVIEAGCRVVDSEIGPGAVVRQGSYLEHCHVGEGSHVGPYAHLRPGARLAEGVKVGNFVEIKNASLGAGTKASHLSYIGDAEIGQGVNLGCGFITCNYDGGPQKHRTVIEDGVFVGSDSQMVAPVRVGEGSYIASGSTVTEDVPAQSLVISRGKQVTKAGYAAKYKKKK